MPVFLSLLVGCSSWIDQEASCEYDVYEWSDDLLAHILAGDASGAFDYDPEDAPRNQVEGSYDPADGNYEWDEKYADEYYLKRTSVAGFGTAYHNGDLDILHTATVTDILEQVSSTVVRLRRDACDMTIETWPEEDPEAVFVMQGSYENDESWAWSAESASYSYSGGMRANLSHSSRTEAKNGTYVSYATTKPAGTTDVEFSGTCGDDDSVTCDGTTRYRFDGGSESSYAMAVDGDPYADVVSDFSYAGAGTLTAAFADGDVCVYEYTPGGECECSCEESGGCSC